MKMKRLFLLFISKSWKIQIVENIQLKYMFIEVSNILLLYADFIVLLTYLFSYRNMNNILMFPEFYVIKTANVFKFL